MLPQPILHGVLDERGHGIIRSNNPELFSKHLGTYFLSKLTHNFICERVTYDPNPAKVKHSHKVF
jgi:hypothetical protein